MIFVAIVLGLVIAVLAGFVGAAVGALVWLLLGMPYIDSEGPHVPKPVPPVDLSRWIGVFRCVECGRGFEDLDSFDLHIRSTPHTRDAVELITPRVLS